MKDQSAPLPPGDFKPFKPLPPARPRGFAPPPPPPPAARRERRRRQSWLLVAPFLVLMLACSLIGAGLVGLHLYFGERIVPGVRVLGEDVGGMTFSEADAYLQRKLGDPNVLLGRFGSGQIVLRDGARIFRAWPWQIGFRSDFKPALEAAKGIGHRGDLALDAAEQLRALTLGADGSLIAIGGAITAVLAFPVAVVDTVGAGDTYHAALVFGVYFQGWPLTQAGRFASAAAAIKCTRVGGRSGPTRAEVESFLAARQ